jgi:ubiquinol-cytochrome c reductase iron-sulfur subunit
MANEGDALEHERASWKPSRGLAVAVSDPVQNPGLPAHRERITDKDPAAMKHAVRTVYTLFYLSVAASVWAVVAYMVFPIESGSITAIRDNNLFIGLGIAFALLAIGVGAIHWSKAIMSDKEFIEPRHATRGRDATREAVVQNFAVANEESGFGRRVMIRNSLFAALAASVVPGIVLFRGLAPESSPENPNAGDPVYLLSHTMWKEGMRLSHDPSGRPIKASDVTLGSAFHVIPEELADLSHHDGYLEEKAKAIVLLMRMPQDVLVEADDRKDWSYDGIVAYSKVCTHVGCPVALYEQQTHHLLCPCHQSQFDVSEGAKVIFGPAARPLPQLPITVDEEGYLIARSDFTEPVGPSFWERH